MADEVENVQNERAIEDEGPEIPVPPRVIDIANLKER